VEEGGGGGVGTLWEVYRIPGGEGPEGGGLYTVGGPRCVAQLIAHRDGETTVVGPDEADHPALIALNVQDRALAAVLGVPLSCS
jgi:hypothetical protein